MNQPGIRTAWVLSGVAVATIGLGLIGDARGAGLGTANPPFFLIYDRDLAGAQTVLWLLALAACAWAAVPFARGLASPRAFCVAITLLGLGGRLALAGARDGTDAWYSMFGLDPEAGNEYLPALAGLDRLGTTAFLDRFAELSPSLPIHPSAHPPGTLLLADWLGIDGPEAFAALVILVGVLAVPLTFWLARRLDMEEGRARIAAALLAFSPGAMIYGVATADAMFATLGTLAVVLLVGRGAVSRVLGAAAVAVASFFSFALLACGAFAALLVTLREGIRNGIYVALLAGVGVLAFYLGLYAGTGYDPIGFLSAASEAYDLGISNARPWLFWLFGSPVAFFVIGGLPIAWYAARALGTGNAVAVSLAAIVLVAALLGFSKAETERIWLFMAPLACVAAAAIVPRAKVGVVIAILTAQAALIELTMESVW
jgi:hypothetical protein